MQYEVTKDVGVTIAGKKFSHGAVIDTDGMVPKATAEGLDAGTSDEDKKAEIAKRQAALGKQAQTDVDAALKDGFLVPASKQVARAAAAPKEA